MMHKFILIGIVAALVMVVVTGSVSAAVTFEKLTQLTTDPANEYNPAWSPDGNDLIFTRMGSPKKIIKLTIDDLSETQLTSYSCSLQWGHYSPDGTQIAYTKDNCNGWYDVHVVNSDGSSDRCLTCSYSGMNDRVIWHPSSNKIIYENAPNCCNRYPWDIISINPDGSDKTTLVSDVLLLGAPQAMSPDESKILYSTETYRDSHVGWMYIKNLDTGTATDLGRGLFSRQSQSWQSQIFSPDGSKIVYHSDENGNWDIYTTNVDGTGKTHLTTDSSDDRSAYFSPDGSKILFVSDRSGNSDIWVMDVDGSNKVQLTTNTSVDTGPTWSPDGNKIVFQSDRSGNYDIWVMDVSDGEMTEIAYDDGEMDCQGSMGSDTGWGHGVLFEVGAPTTVAKVKIYGRTYDANPSFIPPGFGETFDVEIRDSSLNRLDSVTYNYDDYFTESYGWAMIDIPDISVDGNFYIWLNTKSYQSPDIGKGILIGIDFDSPTGNSFTIETTTDSILETRDSNWMIRAVVYGDDAVDSDGDGIPDDVDNCPCIPNPNQINFDGDGKGNDCDTEFQIGMFINPGEPDVNINTELLTELQDKGVMRIFVNTYEARVGSEKHVFYPEENGSLDLVDLETKGVYNLSTLLTEAHDLNIEVHTCVACFGPDSIDPTGCSGLNQEIALIEVVDYLLRNYKDSNGRGLDGIHLDFVRFVEPYNAKGDASNISIMSAFIKDLKEVVVKNRAKLSASVIAADHESVWPHLWTPGDYYYVKHQNGQDYTKMSKNLDFISPMAYHYSEDFNYNPIYVRDATKFANENVETNCDVIPDIQGYYNNILEKPGANEISQALKSAKRGGARGANIFRYVHISDAEWWGIRNWEKTMASASIECPADLHAYDSLGRHVGMNELGDIDLEIPGAFYTGPDSEPERIIIPDQSDNIIFKVEALDSGEFNLTITQSTDTKTTIVTYLDIPITGTTEATVDVSQANPTYTMSIDDDGDGTPEYETEPDSIETTGGVCGDLNSDGILTPADAAIALRLAATGGWDANADVNRDDRITSLDALMILQAAADAIDL